MSFVFSQKFRVSGKQNSLFPLGPVFKCLLLKRSSGGPKGRQAEPHNYRNMVTCMHRNKNPCNSFFFFKMAGGMDHGCVGPTTTTSRNMTAIQLIPSLAVLTGLQHISLKLDIHMFDSCHIKRSADQHHVIISRAQV